MKIKFLPTDVQEYKWRLRSPINKDDLNLLINHFKSSRLISDEETDGCKYVPYGLSNQFYWGGYTKGFCHNAWQPLMLIQDYNKQVDSKIVVESADIKDCVYKLHDMFPQFTEYWDVVGVPEEEYLEELLDKCESFEILGTTAINTDLVKGNENYTIPVKSVVSYLDNGEIKNVVFDKNLHKIVV